MRKRLLHIWNDFIRSTVGAGEADMEEVALEGDKDSCFLFRNWALRLAFRLFAEGLVFFLVTKGVTGLTSLLSRQKEKLEPILREKLKAWPWLASAWQKAKHCMAREDPSPHIVSAVIFTLSFELKI